jgi:hypothetical protein
VYCTVVVSDLSPVLGAALTVSVACPAVVVDGVTVPGSPGVAVMLETLNQGAATSVTVAVPAVTAIGDVHTCGPPWSAFIDALPCHPPSLML